MYWTGVVPIPSVEIPTRLLISAYTLKKALINSPVMRSIVWSLTINSAYSIIAVPRLFIYVQYFDP